MHLGKNRDPSRKVSPPGPSYMSNQQIDPSALGLELQLISDNSTASYLSDLRTNRPPRPNGSRPLPTKEPTAVPNLNDEMPPRASSAMSNSRTSDASQYDYSQQEAFPRSISALSHRRATSDASSINGFAGRPLVQEPMYKVKRNISPTATVQSTSTVVSPSATYRESGQRWMERQEVRSIRDALDEMDLQSEEQRIHDAAQDEATELVMRHRNSSVSSRNPHAPYQNPELNFSNRFRSHLEKGSHARSHSLGWQTETNKNNQRAESYRSASDSSTGTNSGKEPTEWEQGSVRGSIQSSSQDRKIVDIPGSDATISVKKNGSLRKKPKVNFALPSEEPSSSRRHSSGPRSRIVSNDSSKGIFRNPEDHIYEEPEDSEPMPSSQPKQGTVPETSPLQVKPRNSLPRGARPFPGRASTQSFEEKLSRFEIHKNPPTQSRNPLYKSNAPVQPPVKEAAEEVPTKDGKEIRGEDIRAATSRKLKDRNPNLPRPTAVSDRPGRPIVSFDPTWKSPEEQARERSEESLDQTLPNNTGSTTKDAPPIPTINAPEDPPIPTINLPGEEPEAPSISVSSVPTISAMEPVSEENNKKTRPAPIPRGKGHDKVHIPGRSSTSSSRGSWYSPYTRSGVPTATCAQCVLPISGRIVTAAGSRFHPECFSCHHCNTPLECVAFYSEPDAKRTERLAAADPDDEEAQSNRFYCHLDYHELFSPRCKSCKTPIEGEVVVACGAEWHVGHFFCAECGDPFTPTTPFVEKSGFAWCLRCHSRRSASRCQGCSQPVLDEVVVTALNGQWHQNCFNCSECKGGFGPEGRFFVKEGPPKKTAKGRIIGGPVEYAVCETCEGQRLKNL
ncbi:hypothetical protein FQN54_002072 [Arachnomyces sp. PD_36]|nr:hypothetical protein FQN54_002072 [Arachnomyces sp. PD_36]